MEKIVIEKPKLYESIVIRRQSKDTDSEGSSFIKECLLPSEFGRSRSVRFSVSGKIELQVEEIFCPHDLFITGNTHLEDRIISSSFLLQGAHSIFHDKRSEPVHFGRNIDWQRTPGEVYSSFFPGGRLNRAVHITLDPSILGQNESASSGKGMPLSLVYGDSDGFASSPVKGELLFPYIQDLMNMRIETPWDWLRFEAVILDTVATMMDSCLPVRINRAVFIPENEKEKLHRAKAVLDERLINPPTITELSRIIGLNEFKLKKGFKSIFGETLYGYVRERRMRTALLLLKTGRMNVTEAAMEVGYSTPSSFTVAFQKRFGENPVNFRKRMY